MMRVIGIDPGQHGALALHDGTLIEVVDMPIIAKLLDALALRDQVIKWGAVNRVIIEQVRPVRNGSAMGAFNFGGLYYGLINVLQVLERPVVHVTPTNWTKYHQVGDDKQVHVKRAIELFPSHADMFRGPRGGLLDGRADAALIANYGSHLAQEVFAG